MATPKKELFSFAYFQKFDDAIQFLTRLADHEEWDFPNTHGKTILKNYLEYTYRKIKEENKVCYTHDNKFACFDTGLVTPQLEEIYAFFEKNARPTGQGTSPFYFKAFLKKSDFNIMKHFAQHLPLRADFFADPAALIFNPNWEIIPDIDHIISDNASRFPAELRASGDANMRRQLMGSIDEVKKKVKTNYKIAVPQYFNGKTQLLLPLCLTPGSPNPDLALVLNKDSGVYCARTCLTLEMAYNNARLIVKPQSDWLRP